MGGFNRDIGVGIAIALDGKIMQKLRLRRQPLNRRRVIKPTALCLLQFSLWALGFRASRRLIQEAML
jgi:hypothetical protein